MSPETYVRFILLLLLVSFFACSSNLRSYRGSSEENELPPEGSTISEEISVPDPENMILVHELDFEDSSYDWKTEFRHGDWKKSAARVENKCFGGSGYCLRGNFKADIVDPITGLPGVSNQQLEWAPFAIVENDQVMIRYRFRIDDSTWAGWSNEDLSGDWVTDAYLGKLLYITDVAAETGAFFMGQRTFSYNGAFIDFYHSTPYPWGPYYEIGGATKIWVSNGSEFSLGTDGIWHVWEGYFDSEQDFAQVKIDGKVFKSDQTDSLMEGIIPTPAEFRVRGVQIFYVKQNILVGSENGTDGEYACGWQVDNLEVWTPN